MSQASQESAVNNKNMTASGEPIIQIQKMNKWFGQFHVLKEIDLEVITGERIVICGPSGSGKSTLIRCINRLEEHQEGQIVVDGIELTSDLKHILDTYLPNCVGRSHCKPMQAKACALAAARIWGRACKHLHVLSKLESNGDCKRTASISHKNDWIRMCDELDGTWTVVGSGHV